MQLVKYRCDQCHHIFRTNELQQIYCPKCHGNVSKFIVKNPSRKEKQKTKAEAQTRSRFHGRQKGRAFKSIV